jgi:outer membrane protein OmpA-like peptidoglycan-associated protein/N-acetylneuraminic acid mutarotase
MKKWIFFLLFYFFHSLVFAQTNSRWNKLSNFPSGVLENAVAFSVGDNAFVGSGTDRANFRNTFWKYSPGNESSGSASEKNPWGQIEALPAPPRISAVAFSIGNKGYVGTGMTGSESIKQGTNDFWEYDPEKNSWTQKTNFPGGIRYGAIGFSIGDKGYIALGTNQNTFYNDLWEYTPASNRWTKKIDFPESGKADASVFVIGQDAYVLFGQKKEIFPSKKTSWKYSQTKNEWKQFADFPADARIGAITFSFKNKGYALAGTSGALKRFQDCWEYDAAKDHWSAKEDVPFGACSFGFSFVIGNAAYVSPGKTQSGFKGSEIWKFDLTEKKVAGNSIVIGGSLLLGDERIPLAGVEVKIFNSKNEVVKSAFTNLFGSFLLTQIPEGEDLFFTFESNDPNQKNQKFYLVNRKNEDIAVLHKDNQFRFYLSSANKNKIQLIKVENKNLRMNMQGKLALDDKKKTPLAKVPVSLINEDQEIVQGGTTDENGIFIFTYLPVDSSVYLSIDEKMAATLAKGAKILLLDEGDNVVSKTSTSHPEFQLINLPPEKNTLTKVYMEDPWIEPMMTGKSGEMKVVEHVYFDYDKWEVLPETKLVLNKAIAMLKSNPKFSITISAHTDSRGEAKYNLDLSEKRAAAAKEYMISKGVSASQISAKGYGETKPLNRCVDGVNCTEEEYALNRRLEFLIKRK